MKNAANWARKFSDFSENYQLEIAELIIDELAFNEQIGEESYDSEKSANVRKTFEQLRGYLERQLEDEELTSLFGRISSLSDENKEGLSKAIHALLTKYFDKQEQEDKEAVCEEEGHDFGPWEHKKWTSYERVCIDHQLVDNYPIPHEEWKRTCLRCGFVETVKREPDEVREERLKKEKAAEVKALRKRLRELQG